jgi:hypothetical protein
MIVQCERIGDGKCSHSALATQEVSDCTPSGSEILVKGRERTMNFPEGRLFAFTILDDTDDATYANIAPIYELLRELGIRVTKTAWPLDCPEGSKDFFAAETLQVPEYKQFVRGLIHDGHEFASHGATMESSERERTLRGFDYIESELKVAPRLHCNHGYNRENVYWGADRYTSRPMRIIAKMLERAKRTEPYKGHEPESAFFWGDVCRKQFAYVRGFSFARLDNSRLPVRYPYHEPSKPYVRRWFCTSDAPDVEAFVRLVNKKAVDEMMERRGFSIVSTHLGKGFVRDGRVDPRVEEALRYVASLPGWFVPASEILDWVSKTTGVSRVSAGRMLLLEASFVLDRLTTRLMRREM